MWFEHLRQRLDGLDARDLRRRLRVADSGTAPRQRVRDPQGGARELLMFCGNDYLGLAAHPAIAEALAEGARRWGGGSGASPLVSGHSAAHAAVAAWLGEAFAGHIPRARALGFCTGYMANLGVLTALGDAEVELFCDQLNHASLIDGARLARARVSVYPHADTAALAARLAASTAARKLIATDSVFSMDGDIAPLRELLALAEAHDALLMVDDAHGFGVLGEDGLGALQLLDLRSPRLVLMGTLGKAAGLAGAFVVAQDRVIEFLLQSARNYIFSTAAPPLLEHAVLASLRLIQGPEGRRRRAALRERVAQWRAGAQALLARHPGLGWRLIDSHTPVQALVVGGNAPAMALSARLEAEGLRVPGIRPPTVPTGSARLRVTLCASHAPEDVDQLLHALERAALSAALEVA
ncbi:MAG: 8-amino-7-oxononanoate synthase [Comamonadaceae bacterium]|jgi:8-amino-7-oxononanoate synthase|uniref:8-amino-7-oxononanoate synthase n=1 Tax=Hydrogenophaga borbori TaxID=2294117 RepID=A0A372EJS0_9BURK|nr:MULTISPECIES: 8-amino-7-oxononanoate synthase [Hydrogenophaga]NCT98065.1 8-amino-7-oxononanoate synthase [Comamonadaceae bacterium]RFP79150.1 8-amino-7-oxononanoate synthase [Hydrogenophaga borbori]WQB84162.1 8-amino-7-oxononanoate synthase [Hydrogenophaga sp. SNF1]